MADIIPYSFCGNGITIDAAAAYALDGKYAASPMDADRRNSGADPIVFTLFGLIAMG